MFCFFICPFWSNHPSDWIVNCLRSSIHVVYILGDLQKIKRSKRSWLKKNQPLFIFYGKNLLSTVFSVEAINGCLALKRTTYIWSDYHWQAEIIAKWYRRFSFQKKEKYKTYYRGPRVQFSHKFWTILNDGEVSNYFLSLSWSISVYLRLSWSILFYLGLSRFMSVYLCLSW